MSDNKSRICTITIVIEDRKVAAPEVNKLLSEYGDHVVARLGLPMKDRHVSVICVVLEASNDVCGALSGKLGQVKGITVKTITV